jgi:hypothetical protein
MSGYLHSVRRYRVEINAHIYAAFVPLYVSVPFLIELPVSWKMNPLARLYGHVGFLG